MNYRKFDKALLDLNVHNFEHYYSQWFIINADPLSDDIISDIRQQATDWAMEKTMFHGVGCFQSNGEDFIGLARY